MAAEMILRVAADVATSEKRHCFPTLLVDLRWGEQEVALALADAFCLEGKLEAVAVPAAVPMVLLVLVVHAGFLEIVGAPGLPDPEEACPVEAAKEAKTLVGLLAASLEILQLLGELVRLPWQISSQICQT